MRRHTLTNPVLFALALALPGCASVPISQMNDEYFVIKEIAVDRATPEVARSFVERLIFCGPEQGGILSVTHIGHPICRPREGANKVVCDIYIGYPNPSNIGQSRGVLGRVDFVDNGNTTTVQMRVRYRDRPDRAGEVFQYWGAMLDGSYAQICHR